MSSPLAWSEMVWGGPEGLGSHPMCGALEKASPTSRSLRQGSLNVSARLSSVAQFWAFFNNAGRRVFMQPSRLRHPSLLFKGETPQAIERTKPARPFIGLACCLSRRSGSKPSKLWHELANGWDGFPISLGYFLMTSRMPRRMVAFLSRLFQRTMSLTLTPNFLAILLTVSPRLTL